MTMAGDPVSSGSAAAYDNDEKQAKILKQQRSRLIPRLLACGVLMLLVGYGVGLSGKLGDLAAVAQPLRAQPPALPSLEEAVAAFEKAHKKVRDIRQEVAIFETDEAGQKAAEELKSASQDLIYIRYGKGTINVVLDLEFQPSIPDFEEKGSSGTIVLEMAPSTLIPYAVYSFLELCRTFKRGGFHRFAPHVLQTYGETSLAKEYSRDLAFQEYSPKFPHAMFTCGFAGRPSSGKDWYISTMDNTKNHGPGSQNPNNPLEADVAFAKVVDGFDIVKRIQTVPGQEFIDDVKLHVLIKSMTIQPK